MNELPTRLLYAFLWARAGGISMLFIPRTSRLVFEVLCSTLWSLCSPVFLSGAWTIPIAFSPAFITAKHIFITKYPRMHVVISKAAVTISVLTVYTHFYNKSVELPSGALKLAIESFGSDTSEVRSRYNTEIKIAVECSYRPTNQ